MINLDSITTKDNKKHNEKWPYILDYPYKIIIISSSGSGKTNTLTQNLFVCKRFKQTKV